MTAERVVFHGIDRFNRPVFKSLDHPNQFFGSVEVLFAGDASEADVLAKIDANHLTFFGRSFDCEPMGTPASVLIVSAAEGRRHDR
jgi:hypothetical protein